MPNEIDARATAATRARHYRIAPVYDLIEMFLEHSFKPWREKLWLYASSDVLEVGVGTGKNFHYHPRDAHMVGIDFADQMLARARERPKHLGAEVDLREGNVQELEFPDNAFDTVVATFVFCSVPEPILGLREVSRVVKPNGKIILLEHVRIDRLIRRRSVHLCCVASRRFCDSHSNSPLVHHLPYFDKEYVGSGLDSLA